MMGSVVAVGLLVVASGIAGPDAECTALDFSAELRDHVNPVSLLEEGNYVFDDGQSLSRDCLRNRVCQVNEFTRTHYKQSYYVSLKTRGGVEIERQFPEVVRSVLEARGDERMVNLNNFCRKLTTK